MSVFTASSLIMWFAIRHQLNDTAIEDLLLLMNYVLPTARFPTKYKFLKMYDRMHAQTLKKYYCYNCEVVLDKIDANGKKFSCPDCKEEHDKSALDRSYPFFLYIPIQPQLEQLIYSSVYDLVRKTSIGNYADVCQGGYYQQMRQKGKIGPNDLTLQVNTDGVSLFKRSPYSLWPLQAVINELPYSIRRKEMLLCGLWFAKEKPLMNLFLSFFVNEMETLSSIGIIHRTKGIRIKIHVLLFTVDSVARPLLQNLTQFNGKYGCTYCLNEGEVVAVGEGFTRVYSGAGTARLRSIKQHLRDGESALLSGEPVNGVKGATVLCDLHAFDVTVGFSVDYMHSILFGGVKTFLVAWFDSSNHQKDWYLGNKNKEFDEKLLAMCPPKEITRTPRSIKPLKQWKASEYKNFLLYYSFTCIRDLLPKVYVRHWTKLIFAVYIFLKTNFTKNEGYEAKKALSEFVEEIENLYGKSFYKFNIHLLLHVGTCVDNFGALWAHSGFIFENYNGILAKMYYSSQGVPQQICKNYMRFKQLDRITSNHCLDKWQVNSIELYKRLSGKSYGNLIDDNNFIDSVYFFKNRSVTFNMSLIIKTSVEETLQENIISNHAEAYPACIVNGRMIVHSFQKSKMIKRNNSVVKLHNGEFVIIQRILVVCTASGYRRLVLQTEALNKVSKECMTRNNKILTFGNIVSLYTNVTKSGQVSTILPNMIDTKAVLIPYLEEIDKKEVFYVVSLPNYFERD